MQLSKSLFHSTFFVNARQNTTSKESQPEEERSQDISFWFNMKIANLVTQISNNYLQPQNVSY